MVLQIFCGVLALVLVLVGFVALFEPSRMARLYGVPVDGAPGSAFVRATGARDLAFGLALGAAAYFRDEPLLIVLAVVGVLLSMADFSIVYYARGKSLHIAHGFHASGIIAFLLVITMVLLAFGW